MSFSSNDGFPQFVFFSLLSLNKLHPGSLLLVKWRSAALFFSFFFYFEFFILRFLVWVFTNCAGSPFLIKWRSAPLFLDLTLLLLRRYMEWFQQGFPILPCWYMEWLQQDFPRFSKTISALLINGMITWNTPTRLSSIWNWPWSFWPPIVVLHVWY